MTSPIVPGTLLVTLTVADLRALLSEALCDSLAPSQPPREVLTRREAADFLRTSVATLDRLARDGEIPSRRVGDSPRYLRADLLAYVRGDAPAGSPVGSPLRVVDGGAK